MSQPINILIADKHPLYKIALKTILLKAGRISHVLEASDGKELINALKKKAYSIVFIDINLPLMSFENYCKLIKADYPETKVIVISAYDDAYTIQKVFDAGCVGFILKTEGEKEILEALEKVRNGRRYFGNKVPDILLNKKNDKEVKRENHLSLFSETELTVLKAICLEKTNHEITNLVFRSTRTIEGYRRKIYKKANAKNPVGLIRFAIRNGIIAHDEI